MFRFVLYIYYVKFLNLEQWNNGINQNDAHYLSNAFTIGRSTKRVELFAVGSPLSACALPGDFSDGEGWRQGDFIQPPDWQLMSGSAVQIGPRALELAAPADATLMAPYQDPK